ncbi:MAG: DUF4145 domain-containing protein [Candidatus Thiodiazotropha sp. 4PDIVS1]
MIIECNQCEAKVDAKEIGSHFYNDAEVKLGFYLCPVCESVLVGQSDLVLTRSGDAEFTPASRLWPEPYQQLDTSIPETVRRSIEDARKCYQSGVYSAAAVMCGKAIEFVTVEKTSEKTLFKGLKAMKEQNLIDERLFEWAEALRKERNIGAHAVNEETTVQDASDILDFAVAFCEYVYVLTQKYDEYLARKSGN